MIGYATQDFENPFVLDHAQPLVMTYIQRFINVQSEKVATSISI